jgi:hypothetical protein
VRDEFVHSDVRSVAVVRAEQLHLVAAYVSIRPHTSAYVYRRVPTRSVAVVRAQQLHLVAAYVRIRPHTSAYVYRLVPTLKALHDVGAHPHTSAYVSIRPHTSAYVSIRQKKRNKSLKKKNSERIASGWTLRSRRD